MKIKDLPQQNRPRERFIKQGPGVLSDAELFAILLRTGTKGENVIDLSNRLIAEYGLNGLFDCSIKELEKIKGIGPTKAMQILTIREMLNRIKLAKREKWKISSSKDAFEFMHEKLKNEKQEHFFVLMLDNQNNIIEEKEVSKGLLDTAIIDPREVFKFAIKNSAAKIILIHNHPSGDTHPSQEDLLISERIIESGELLGIKVLDHIIVGNGDYWSRKDDISFQKNMDKALRKSLKE